MPIAHLDACSFSDDRFRSNDTASGVQSLVRGWTFKQFSALQTPAEELPENGKSCKTLLNPLLSIVWHPLILHGKVESDLNFF
jgi:hypothetical protein